MRYQRLFFSSLLSAFIFSVSSLSAYNSSLLPLPDDDVSLADTVVVPTKTAFDNRNSEKPSLWKRWGWGIYGHPGQTMATNAEQKLYMKSKMSVSVAAEIQHSALPCDSSFFDEDYNYPTLGFGVKVSMNHAVKLHKPSDPMWGMAEEVDYDSRLGNTVSFYGTFSRPLFRLPHWEADYTMNAGIGYSHRKYNTHDNIDNELIGARWLIFFGLGLHATWHFAPQWGLKAGLDYWHLSNGSLSRPNKGVNVIGPSLGFIYTPYFPEMPRSAVRRTETGKQVYVQLSAGVGGKALREEWQRTQYDTPKDAPDYRTDKFPVYATISWQADLMCRYARRWASGAGVDVFYGTYYKRLAYLDRLDGHETSHSPVSVGLSAKHEIFYHQFSFAVSVGYYIYREMGYNAYLGDAPYYERIGINYTLPRLNHLKCGIHVKAHKGKADFTEIVFGMPIVLKRL